jgi:glycosyltransferase involved in cell wall biosynthesis
MVQRGHQVTLVHCVNTGTPMPTKQDVREALGLEEGAMFESICLRFPSMGLAPGHYLKESYAYSKQIFDLLKTRYSEFDFVYAKGFSAWHTIDQKKKGLKIPPIGVKFHGYEMFQPAANFKALWQQMLLKSPVRWNTLNADYVFSYGGQITEIIKRIGVKPTQIIEAPTGIEGTWLTEKVLPHSGKTKFLFLGRYERRKGIEELNQALTNVLPKNLFEFHFVGPIPPSKKIQSEAVTYHGQLTDKSELQKVMDACDVLVVPSHSEGMPNVIMEGMARGMAVLATDVGAIKLLIDERSGKLIQPKNIQQLSDGLVEFSQMDSAKLLEIRHNARKRVEELFTWEEVVKAIEKEILVRL